MCVEERKTYDDIDKNAKFLSDEFSTSIDHSSDTINIHIAGLVLNTNVPELATKIVNAIAQRFVNVYEIQVIGHTDCGGASAIYTQTNRGKTGTSQDINLENEYNATTLTREINKQIKDNKNIENKIKVSSGIVDLRSQDLIYTERYRNTGKHLATAVLSKCMIGDHGEIIPHIGAIRKLLLSQDNVQIPLFIASDHSQIDTIKLILNGNHSRTRSNEVARIITTSSEKDELLRKRLRDLLELNNSSHDPIYMLDFRPREQINLRQS